VQQLLRSFVDEFVDGVFVSGVCFKCNALCVKERGATQRHIATCFFGINTPAFRVQQQATNERVRHRRVRKRDDDADDDDETFSGDGIGETPPSKRGRVRAAKRSATKAIEHYLGDDDDGGLSSSTDDDDKQQRRKKKVSTAVHVDIMLCDVARPTRHRRQRRRLRHRARTSPKYVCHM
jgi:hypothetical protein